MFGHHSQLGAIGTVDRRNEHSIDRQNDATVPVDRFRALAHASS